MEDELARLLVTDEAWEEHTEHSNTMIRMQIKVTFAVYNVDINSG